MINVVKENTYQIQYYDEDHKDEYTVMELENNVPNGIAQLFKNGVLQLSWTMLKGKRNGSFTLYLNGRAYCSSTWNHLNESKRTGYVKSIYNDVSGRLLLMENVVETGIITFKGLFDKNQKREGFGIEYDEATGLPLRCGYYIGDHLYHISADFEHSSTVTKSSSFLKCTESVMIEYGGDENMDNVNDLPSRYPIYIGDYEYDELGFRFIHSGRGNTIDSKTGINTGMINFYNHSRTITLKNGWFLKGVGDKSLRSFAINELDAPKPSTHRQNSTTTIAIDFSSIPSSSATTSNSSSQTILSSGLNLKVSQMIEDFTIGNFCYNAQFVDALKATVKFADMPNLKSIKIGNNSFQGIRSFIVSKLYNLKHIIIESQCCRYFNNVKQYTFERSDGEFIVKDCGMLSSISIGNASFCDYNHFELSGLASLAVLNFGDNCFWCADLNLRSALT